MYSSYLLYFMYTLYLLIAGKPPPGGFSYLAGSLPKNPEKKNPPRSKLYKSFGGDPLPPGSWLGNLPNETSPEGGVSRDQYSRCILFHIYYVYILSYKLYFVYVSTHVASLHGVRGSISNLLVCTFQLYPTSYIPYTYSLLLMYTCVYINRRRSLARISRIYFRSICRDCLSGLSLLLSLSLALSLSLSLSLCLFLSVSFSVSFFLSLSLCLLSLSLRLSSLYFSISFSRSLSFSISFSRSLSFVLARERNRDSRRERKNERARERNREIEK